MKRITTYVSPSKTLLLISEFGYEDISEIKLVAYFKPLSEVSRIDLLCEDGAVERVREIIHRFGSNGGLPDQMIFVSEFQPQPSDRARVGTRMGQLDD